MPTLDFKGKRHIYAHHLTVPYRPLVPDPDKSVGDCPDDDNLIIHGDNLHALKALLPRYAGRVKCIYIDPPYNTGNESWVYNDNANGPILKQWLADEAPIDGEDLERHDKWLCMMWPRLHLLKELLSEDGVIFVSIDDNEQHHLRMLMDEIFGEQNFIASFVWHHRKSNQNDIDVSLSHNYISCYAASRKQFQFTASEIDESRFTNPDNDPRGPWVADPMDAPNIRENLTYEIVNPVSGASYWPPTGRCWRFTQDKFDQARADGRIIFGKTGLSRPQYKRYLSEAVARGRNVSTIWSDVGTATAATKELMKILGRDQSFPTPKPTDLVKKILRLSFNGDCIILDSFAGSGSTAQAVLELNAVDGGNRRFVLVECEDYADSLTAERVRRVIAGVPDVKDSNLREGLGGSFTYCSLGEPVTASGMLDGETLPTFASLAAWLMHTATGQSVGPAELRPLDEHGLIYSDSRRNYYLRYEPDLDWLRSNEAVLTEGRAEDIAEICREQQKEAVVFAAGKYIELDDLSELNIMFGELPFEIRRSEQV